jgi:hypothetical protein
MKFLGGLACLTHLSHKLERKTFFLKLFFECFTGYSYFSNNVLLLKLTKKLMAKLTLANKFRNNKAKFVIFSSPQNKTVSLNSMFYKKKDKKETDFQNHGGPVVELQLRN